MKYRVINEETWEGFTVEGKTVAECQLKADAECELRGWSVMVMRSEKVEVNNE